jgi:hypothetical protein
MPLEFGALRVLYAELQMGGMTVNAINGSTSMRACLQCSQNGGQVYRTKYIQYLFPFIF